MVVRAATLDYLTALHLEEEALVGGKLASEKDFEQPDGVQYINDVEFFIISILTVLNQLICSIF